MTQDRQPAVDRAHREEILACPQCDLVQYAVALQGHADVRCVRCGGVLYGSGSRLEVLLALAAADALLFCVANLFPVVSAQIEGTRTTATLSGTALDLYRQGRPLVAMLVGATAVLLPALQRIVLLYLLLPLRSGYVPGGVTAGFRLLQAARSWSMVEVFLLGTMVTFVKLAEYATVIPGVALWALGGSVVLSAALWASLDARDFWMRVESAGLPRASGHASEAAP